MGVGLQFEEDELHDIFFYWGGICLRYEGNIEVSLILLIGSPKTVWARLVLHKHKQIQPWTFPTAFDFILFSNLVKLVSNKLNFHYGGECKLHFAL